jgi:hypothetical protein
MQSLCVLLLAGTLLAVDHTFFWLCDYQLWYTPIFEDVVRAWKAGEWPILTQGSWAAGNLAGEYQAATFSVFFNVCLVLVWSLPLSLPLKAAVLSITHLVVLACGAHLLARERGLSKSTATLVGVLASCNGWLIEWGATEWFVALGGFVWVPWLWWSLERLVRKSSRRVQWVWPALFAYLLISAGSPYAVLMGGLVSAWLGGRWLAEREWHLVRTLAVAWLFGLAWSAPAWLALIGYAQISDRHSTVLNSIQHAWRVPWTAWVGVFLPSLNVPWLSFDMKWTPHVAIDLACGLIPPSVVFAALLQTKGQVLRRYRADFVLLALVIVLATAPGYESFRWSFRWLPLFHLVLALLAARCFSDVDGKTCAKWAVIWTATAWAVTAATETNHSHIFAAVLLALASVWWLGEYLSPRFRPWLPTGIAMGALLAVFLLLPVKQHVSQHRFTDRLLQPEPLDPARRYVALYAFGDIIDEVAGRPGFGSVRRVCNTPLLANLRFLNGYTSFSASGVPRFFETHGSVQEKTAEFFTQPQAEGLLELLGVDGMIFSPRYAHFGEKLTSDWFRFFESEEGVVYHRLPARSSPVKILDALEDRPGVRFGDPLLTHMVERRNRVRVTVTDEVFHPVSRDDDLGEIAMPASQAKPFALAFRRPWFPGYIARLNGAEISVRAYLGLVPLVELPAGASGKLELVYCPTWLRNGSTVALSALALWFAGLLSSMRKRREVGGQLGE